MKRLAEIFAFLVLTYLAGGLIAKAYLDSVIWMPDWLRYASEFVVRMTGLDPAYHTEETDIMAEFIVSCISWALTGLMLWLVVVKARRSRARNF